MRTLLLFGVGAIAGFAACGHHDHFWFEKKVSWDRVGRLGTATDGPAASEPVLNVEKGICDGTRSVGTFTLGSAGSYRGLFKADTATSASAPRLIAFAACEVVGRVDYATLKATTIAQPCGRVIRCAMSCLPDGNLKMERCSGDFAEVPLGLTQPLRMVPAGTFVNKGSIGERFLVDTVESCRSRAEACLR